MSRVNKYKTVKGENVESSTPLTVTKNVNFKRSRFVTPNVPRLQKKASTPTDDNNSTVSSFGDLSNISGANIKSKTSDSGDDFLYSKHLRASFLESLIEKDLESKSGNIDEEISNLSNRLEQSRLLLEETDRNIKEIKFLSHQSLLLKTQEDVLDKSLEYENHTKQCSNLGDLNKVLQSSSDLLDVKNIKFEEEFSQISHDGITKLNEALSNLKIGIQNLGTHKSSLQEMRLLRENLEESVHLMQNISQLSDQTTANQEELDKILIIEESVKLMQS